MRLNLIRVCHIRPHLGRMSRTKRDLGQERTTSMFSPVYGRIGINVSGSLQLRDTLTLYSEFGPGQRSVP